MPAMTFTCCSSMPPRHAQGRPAWRWRLPFHAALACAVLAVLLAHIAAADERDYYDAQYRARIAVDSGTIEVELSLSGRHLPSRIVMNIASGRYRNFSSAQPLQLSDGQAVWRPQGRKSTLRYEFIVDHKRSSKGYDSLLTDSWTIFRADKLVPRVRVTARKNLHSRAVIEFMVPQGWSVITPYAPSGPHRYAFDDPARRFDRPLGWMLAGKIGSRGEFIRDTHVIVAAPVGESARRQDMLAFLNWNLPHLLDVFPQFPKRTLIVTAGDPMWRGGLSGPASMYVHARLPLISENRTSTPLHELTHIALGIRSDEESDWIVEGMAEFYSLEILRRSGGISKRRHAQALQGLQDVARQSPSLFTDNSSGATTARAVLVMHALDMEIRQSTHGKASLDDVARRLAKERGTITLLRLQQTAAALTGSPLRSLERRQLRKFPGQ